MSVIVGVLTTTGATISRVGISVAKPIVESTGGVATVVDTLRMNVSVTATAPC